MSDYSQLIKEIPNGLHDKYLCLVMKELDKHCIGASQNILSIVKGIHSYDNYITKDEYDELIMTLVNKDGIVDNFKCEEIERYLTASGYKLDCEGKYNKYALFLAMNYVRYRHNEFVKLISSSTNYGKLAICHQLATDHLNSGKKNWIRDLFCL